MSFDRNDDKYYLECVLQNIDLNLRSESSIDTIIFFRNNDLVIDNVNKLKLIIKSALTNLTAQQIKMLV